MVDNQRQIAKTTRPACARHCPSRRAVLAGVGAVAMVGLSGCSSYGSNDAAAAAPSGTPLAKTTDIPVAGGTIFADAKVVVTQPTAGTFKAFSAVCTHQGCVVDDVAAGVISCPCHGSQFTLGGDVAQGPATQPLRAQQITVSGGDIRLA